MLCTVYIFIDRYPVMRIIHDSTENLYAKKIDKQLLSKERLHQPSSRYGRSNVCPRRVTPSPTRHDG